MYRSWPLSIACLRAGAPMVLSALSLVVLPGPGAAERINVERFQYVSPVPDSRCVSPWNNIVIRAGDFINRSTVHPERLAVRGAESGVHDGTLIVSDDAKTLVFTPRRPFALGETVSVALEPGITTLVGESLPHLAFGFSVARADPMREPHRFPAGAAEDLPLAFQAPSPSLPSPSASATAAGPCGLPSTYPAITLLTSDRPEPGHVFIAPFNMAAPRARAHMIILDNLGLPIFYRSTPGRVFDFKRQANGLLTCYAAPAPMFVAFDSSYAVIDSFRTGNGYTTDEHDLQLLPNGHALLLAYDQQPVRMDTVVAGGNPDALVLGLIVQEIDAAKNVVFQWRSWDHFAITDMVEGCTGNLTDAQIDYVHGNAVELDDDGNLLISSRNMSEITKIDRRTGDILWRFGLNAKNNQFAFANDTRGFSHQHDIRRLPNGHITLYDNGNCLTPIYSQALEYALDEENKIATRVWSHRNTPDTYAPFMGNAQRRDGGGTMIGWGGTGPNPKLTDLHAGGTKAYEIGFGSGSMYTYRAFRFPWTTSLFAASPESLDFGTVGVGSTGTLPLSVRNRSGAPLTINCFYSSDAGFSVDDAVPIAIPGGASVTVTARFSPAAVGEFGGALYVRSSRDTEMVAQPVAIRGVGLRGLAISDVALDEGNAGTTPFDFTVSLPRPLQTDVSVDFATADGSATVAGGDYIAASGTAVIPAGEVSATVRVLVVGDAVDEYSETFFVNLSNPVNWTIEDSQAQGTIRNDDGLLAAGEPQAAPASYALHACQPNPVGRGATLRFDLPRAGRVDLAVFDVRGRRVDTIVSGVRPAGRHQGVWPARGCPSGVYFYRLTAGSFVQTRKFVLLE